MEDNKVDELLKRYHQGIATAEEKAWVETWYLRMENQTEEINISQIREDEQRSRLILQQQLFPVKIVRKWPRLLVAAAVLAMVCLSGYWFLNNRQQQQVMAGKTTASYDVAPGSDKAILTLADGRKITLDDAGTGQLANESGIVVTKTAQGQLIYTVSGTAAAQELSGFNTITTPRGGQYQVVLPDGTHVWLNAASSLQYPVAFSRQKREVRLSGEACFDVTEDKKRPFKILTTHLGREHIAEVLGTVLNINAYDDEAAVKTTLISGAVRVRQNETEATKILQPGQQAVWSETGWKLKEVDAEAAIAWKNGYFVFEEEELASIMRKIGRWYDIETEYKDRALPQMKFNGTVSRYEQVSKVMNVLELTQAAHFTLAGNKIVVSL